MGMYRVRVEDGSDHATVQAAESDDLNPDLSCGRG